MLASHRGLSETDVMQMNNMRKVGIATPQIYGSLANQSGDFERMGFRKKDLYNQIGRQRKERGLDAKSALQYLRGLGSNDPLMYVRHTVDEANRLQHLFWCDGIMQMDYKVFGDVLAFDATYGKNKYKCHLVIFSGVNHHNHTVVFGSALVANETEDTDVWLLQHFLEAMKGKLPESVITDGDVAMKNSIRKVMPSAHHRLCAWHLLRNATSNLKKPSFTEKFRRCMLGDYEIGYFRKKWREIVSQFGLQDNKWVTELYEKKNMWCTTFIRGQFFGGFRTTSRCEGLNSEIRKFIHSRYNVTEFLQHFHRCVSYMRYREVEFDFDSVHGEIPLQTHFQSLEWSAANLFTKEVFYLFRPLLDSSSAMRVIGEKQTYLYIIYTLSKYQVPERVWHVSFYQKSDDYKCSYQRLESFGLPCDHILAVLVHLNVPELPKCLVLKRWTKHAKDDIRLTNNGGQRYWDSHKEARYLSLMEYYKDLSVLACDGIDDYDDEKEKVINELQYLRSKKVVQSDVENPISHTVSQGVLRDPAHVKTKGSQKRYKKVMKCSMCNEPGHNRRRCPTVRFPIEQSDVSFDNEGFNANIGHEYFDDDSVSIGGYHSTQASRNPP